MALCTSTTRRLAASANKTRLSLFAVCVGRMHKYTRAKGCAASAAARKFNSHSVKLLAAAAAFCAARACIVRSQCALYIYTQAASFLLITSFKCTKVQPTLRDAANAT